jgi:crotonobetainyl-CoA:carnitine CoA-transferase CaiB-like acyl-CoA transferase
VLTQCLGGLRVLDLSQYLPGPHAGQILADLGAEVVKLEPPAGDPMRGLGPIDRDGVSAFYKLVNAGKTVVRLDLRAAAGRAAFTALVRAGDVLIESFRPGALARLGFGPEALKELNPRLVHTALSGYGQSGPYAGRAGHDLNYMALAGGLATSGTAARPVMAHPPTADFAGGMQAALVALAGLLRRDRSGAGGFFDVSLSESVLAWQAMALTAARRPGFAPQRAAGLLNGGAACYQVYETADRRFATLGALEAKFWAAFCRAVGHEAWIVRQNDSLPQSELIGEVAALFASRPLAHWSALLEDVDCCFHPVMEPLELPEHAQLRARGLVRAGEGPEPLVEVLFPAFLDGAGPAPRKPLHEAQVAAVLESWQAG